MAKAPKRTTVADSRLLQSTPDDWMPLTAAFLHIQQVVGGEQLAEEDLRQRLASGDVEAQNRWVSLGERIDIIRLAPEVFEAPYGLFPRVSELQGHVNFLRRVELLRSNGHNFFVLRKDVHRVWPIAGEAKKPREAALPRTRPKGIGPKAWLTANKVWELWRDGYRWPDREALLRKVRVATDDKGLSPRTLDEALAYLRKKRLIDR
jgi:hypothetical protein